MLSGVVTEIGGLISHGNSVLSFYVGSRDCCLKMQLIGYTKSSKFILGAVVAREFGLPCIVGAQRATSVFKSG